MHIRYLIVIAVVLCALIIGYNAFYVPDASMSVITVAADSSVASSNSSSEEYVPKLPAASAAGTESTGKSADGKSAGGKININTATEQQLSNGLDSIGAVMAKRIIEYRQKNGSFHSTDELKQVSGIGDKTFEKIRDKITVGD